MSVDAYLVMLTFSSYSAPEPYQPSIQQNYYYDNDFGFGNMQTMDEENYDNEPPLLEGRYLSVDLSSRVRNRFQSYIQQDSRSH